MERRRTARRTPDPGEPISRARLRTGREVAVVDVSHTGALVEGGVRLLPGTHVDVHIVTREGRVLVRSRVARCFVATVQADAVSYRGALAFDRHVDTAGVETAGHGVPEAVGALTMPPGAVHAGEVLASLA